MRMLELLPDVHQELVKNFGLWCYILVAPESLDDKAEIRMIVTYGKTEQNTFKKVYVVVFTKGELTQGWHINRIE